MFFLAMKLPAILASIILLALGVAGGVALDRFVFAGASSPASSAPPDTRAGVATQSPAKDETSPPWATKPVPSSGAKANPAPAAAKPTLAQAAEAEIAQALERGDYANAFERIARLPDGDARNAAYRKAYKHWTRHDPKAAAASAATIEDCARWARNGPWSIPAPPSRGWPNWPPAPPSAA